MLSGDAAITLIHPVLPSFILSMFDQQFTVILILALKFHRFLELLTVKQIKTVTNVRLHLFEKTLIRLDHFIEDKLISIIYKVLNHSVSEYGTFESPLFLFWVLNFGETRICCIRSQDGGRRLWRLPIQYRLPVLYIGQTTVKINT